MANSAWLGVAAADYELHMGRIGQAQANAQLTASWIEVLGAGEPVLFAGSGPGQMLEFLPKAELEGRELSFSDINREFLARVGERLARLGISGSLLGDDIEASTLSGVHRNVVIALVLEHVAWRQVLTSLQKWGTQRALVIVQENPPQIDSAVTPGRDVPGTMQVFRDKARPHLIPKKELVDAMSELGFELASSVEAEVADGKKMVACHFRAA